jgi:hypothetical protein
MKKFLLFFILAITIFIGCAPYAVVPNPSNGEILKNLKEDGKTELTYVGEYSYVSEAGQIIDTHYFKGNKAAVFFSLGRPSISDNTNYLYTPDMGKTIFIIDT